MELESGGPFRSNAVIQAVSDGDLNQSGNSRDGQMGLTEDVCRLK